MYIKNGRKVNSLFSKISPLFMVAALVAGTNAHADIKAVLLTLDTNLLTCPNWPGEGGQAAYDLGCLMNDIYQFNTTAQELFPGFPMMKDITDGDDCHIQIIGRIIDGISGLCVRPLVQNMIQTIEAYQPPAPTPTPH